MTCRVLTPTEALGLPAEAGFAGVLPHVHPDDLQVVAVEDAGRIVACWGVMRVVHLEGLWIDPAYRGRPSVARRLLTTTLSVARRWTSGWALTGADSDPVRAMLARVGAQRVPMDTYVMPLTGAGVCR